MKNILLNSYTSHLDLDHQSDCLFAQNWLHLIKYLVLHCLLRLKLPSGTEKHHDLENITCDPFEYTMGRTILIASICVEKSISSQRAKVKQSLV